MKKKPTETAKQWEYKTIRYKPDMANFEQMMTDHGIDGWELAVISDIQLDLSSGNVASWAVIFKRPL